MIFSVDATTNRIILGVVGDDNVTEVHFDVKPWVDAYGDSGLFSLLNKRQGDTTAYPVEIRREGNTVIWTVSEIDTAKKGYGECELCYVVDDKTKYSRIFSTILHRSFIEVESPEPYEIWLDKLLKVEDKANANETKIQENTTDIEQNAADISNIKQDIIELEERKGEVIKLYFDGDAIYESYEAWEDAEAPMTFEEIADLAYRKRDMVYLGDGQMKYYPQLDLNVPTKDSRAIEFMSSGQLDGENFFTRVIINENNEVKTDQIVDINTTVFAQYKNEVASEFATRDAAIQTADTKAGNAQTYAEGVNTDLQAFKPTVPTMDEFNRLSESIVDIYSTIKDGNKYDRYVWELGTIDLTNGTDKGTATSIRTKNMVFVPNGKKAEIRPVNYSDGSIVVYKADKSFLTYKNYSKATANPSYTATEDCYIRLILKSQTDPSVGDNVYSQYLLDMYCDPKQMHDDIETLKTEVAQNEGLEKRKTIVCFGDSLTQGIGVLTPHQVPTEDYPSVMATILKANVYNGGIGGTTITSQRDGSLCAIADAISSGNWSAIDTAISDLIASHTDGTFDGLTTQFNRIKALNFNEVDVLCLAYGTNDWTANRNLDYPDNQINKGGICSALRYSIQTILTAFPHLRIYFFTPSYRDKLGDSKTETSDTFVNTKGNLLSEVGDAIENTCKELHIPCKNMYYASNLNRFTRDAYMFDGTHRNADGYKLLASQYAKFILSN